MTGLRTPAGWLTLIFCVVTSLPCFASESFESFDRVLARTRSAIVADIGSVKESRVNITGSWRVLTVRAAPVETLFGENFTARPLDCRYDEATVVRSGDVVDYLVVSGSGIEFGTKTGDRVILLIAANGARPEECRILRMEPLDKRTLIKQFGATRSPG